MKKAGTDLSRHYRQAFDYWVQAVPDRPRYVLLCNFDGCGFTTSTASSPHLSTG